MRLALAQTCLKPVSVEEAVQAVEERTARAAASGADLVVFPELFICGYLNAATARALALDATELARRLSPVARRHRIAICTGYAERDGTILYNAAMLMGGDGERLLNYRKMHLWGALERNLFSPGSPCEVVQVEPGCSLGLLICYDLDIAAATQDLQRRSADLVVAISATGADYRVVPRMQVPTRAYENAVCVAFCNHAGGEGDLRFAGESAVAAPDGSFLARGGEGCDEMIVADYRAMDWRGYRSRHRYVDDQRTDHFPLRPLAFPG